MPTRTVYVYGCEDAAIVTPGATPTLTDIPGMKEAALSIEQTVLENSGDDDLLDVWLHSQKAKIDLTFATTNLDVIAALKGETVATSGTGSTQKDSVPFGTAAELVAANIMLRLKIAAQVADAGSSRYFYVYLYNVKPIECAPSGFKEKGETVWKFSGMCIRKATNELGAAVSPSARGRFEVAQ